MIAVQLAHLLHVGSRVRGAATVVGIQAIGLVNEELLTDCFVHYFFGLVGGLTDISEQHKISKGQ